MSGKPLTFALTFNQLKAQQKHDSCSSSIKDAMVSAVTNYNFSKRDLETLIEFDNRSGICVTGSFKIEGSYVSLSPAQVLLYR